MLGWLMIVTPVVVVIIYTIVNKILKSNRIKSRVSNVRGVSGAPYKLNKGLKYLYRHEQKLYAFSYISVLYLIIVVLLICTYHVKTRSFIAKYERAAIEYEIRSDTFSMPERVAAFNYATKLTAEAAVYQYWDKYFDPFIPDEINDLKLIR